MVSITRQNQGSNRGSLIKSLKTADWVPHLIIYSVLASTISVISTGFLAVSLFKIANKPDPVLVQTNAGPVAVDAKENLHRSPQHIRDFAEMTLSMLFNWSGKTIDEYGIQKKDSGVEIGRDRISTLAFEAQYALSNKDRFRDQVIDKIAEWTEPGYFTGNQSQHLEINRVMLPRTLKKEGHWSVNVVATRVITKNKQTEKVAFNRTLFIRAVPITKDPLPEAATSEQKAFYKLRQYGLEVYKMQKFSREDI